MLVRGSFVGKYRKYARKKTKKRLKKLLTPVAVAMAFLYIAMTIYVVIPIRSDLVRYSLVGDRVVNVTLLRATYIAPPEDRNYTILVTVGSEVVEFNVPKGSEWKTFHLRESKLVRVSGDLVNTFFRVVELPTNISYPGPYINLTRVGRSEDYILSQYPLEAYFVLSTQLCNASIRVEYSGVSLGSIKVEYSEWEDGPRGVAEIACSRGSCVGTVTNGCVFNYRVSAEPTAAGILKLKFEDGKLYLRLLDNPWITAALYVATILPLWIYVKKHERPYQLS